MDAVGTQDWIVRLLRREVDCERDNVVRMPER